MNEPVRAKNKPVVEQTSQSVSLYMDKPVARGRAKSPTGAPHGTASSPGSGTHKPVNGMNKPVME